MYLALSGRQWRAFAEKNLHFATEQSYANRIDERLVWNLHADGVWEAIRCRLAQIAGSIPQFNQELIGAALFSANVGYKCAFGPKTDPPALPTGFRLHEFNSETRQGPPLRRNHLPPNQRVGFISNRFVFQFDSVWSCSN